MCAENSERFRSWKICSTRIIVLITPYWHWRCKKDNRVYACIVHNTFPRILHFYFIFISRMRTRSIFYFLIPIFFTHLIFVCCNAEQDTNLINIIASTVSMDPLWLQNILQIVLQPYNLYCTKRSFVEILTLASIRKKIKIQVQQFQITLRSEKWRVKDENHWHATVIPVTRQKSNVFIY
jgi:hypothetical protein